jgi:NADH dehydrogenase
MATAPFHFDVVIAGGGFAGINCAQALACALGSGSERRVALIADQNYMLFQPMLAEVAGSSLSPRHVVNPIRGLCRGATVLRGSIEKIDLAAGQLELNAGDFSQNVHVGFQHLALALGGVVDLSRVPGMPEHAFLMKNVGDALKLRGAVLDRFEEANLIADAALLPRLLTFVVVGGGYSGVETAGQLLDLADGVRGYYPRIANESFRVVLVHSGAHLLPEISEQLGRYCEEKLRTRGVEILLSARVTAMTSSKVKLGDGRVIESHTVVSTVGNAPHPRVIELCEAAALATEKGRITTEPTLRVPGQTQLWAAGDCAAVPQAGGGTCPPTGQFAMRQGTLLGQNLAKALAGRDDLAPFTFKGLGSLASIGHRTAVAEIMGLKFSGFFAWWIWRTIYLSKLPGIERKLRVLIDWTLDLFFPRDITLFQPRYTKPLEDMHLEPGDAVFHAGEPAFSFYVVKSGRIELRDEMNAVVRTYGVGEHFGQRALLEDHKWRYTAIAAEPTTLISLSARVFDAITRTSTPIRERLLSLAAVPDGSLPEA